MKKAIILTVALLLFTGVTFAKDFEVLKKAGPNQVQISIDKNPPIAGKNNATFKIQDPQGKAIKDAKVTVMYDMAAMPGMPPANYKVNANLKGEVYTAPINFSMSGPWTVIVKISKDGKVDSIKFSVDVQ